MLLTLKSRIKRRLAEVDMVGVAVIGRAQWRTEDGSAGDSCELETSQTADGMSVRSNES